MRANVTVIVVLAACSFNSKETVVVYVDAGAGKADAGAGADADGGIADAGMADAGPIDGGTGCEGIDAGQDPRSTCATTASTTCGTTGTCDGTGRCAFHPSSTVVVSATCVNTNTRQDPTYCLGDGGIGQTPASKG